MLTIHRAERADALVAALGAQLARPSADPFAPEIVAVPSRGIERWLAQQLSHRLGALDDDGVCANVLFPAYPRLLDDAVSAADERYASSIEAWTAEHSVWPLLAVIDESIAEPTFRMLAVHLGLDRGEGACNGRRFAVASKLARHFAAYGNARPHMLRSWLAGRDERGDGQPLPPDLSWQAELWRRLRRRIDLPSPAELLDDVCRDLTADDLPPEFSIFGPTRMSSARVAVLSALARTHDVHIWLQHPSPALWDAVRRTGLSPGPRAQSHVPVRNPLLASLSRDITELQLVLGAGAPDATDRHHAAVRPARTVLGQIQRQLATDTAPAERTATDDSLVVHACHGPARQVEVLREAILGMLAGDPTLEPRDIVIMCPDVETFAPLIAAGFGMAETAGGHPAAGLRVKLADRSLRQTNPLLTLLSQLLEIVQGRVTATAVLDLAGAPPVRAAFGFDDDDLERLRGWTVTAGARWGLDGPHRAAYGLDSIEQGTWRAALDRLLLGVAMEEGANTVGDTLPLDDVDSADIELAGRFAELLDRLDDAVQATSLEHTVATWAGLLRDIVLGLGEPAEPWQATQLRRELDDIAESAGDTELRVTLTDMIALLDHRLAGRPTRASFRTGTLTVCTLVPMRSVPHRVICLLGMDDGAFPRQAASDGDDVLARDPRTGERDIRSEDRQLFLDAICAAQERLVITYTGADPRTGQPVPPCVPVGELLDAVDATATGPGGTRARDVVVVRHPLQPFDPRNFRAGVLGTPAPFSFDPAGLAGARAAIGPRAAPPPVVGSPLPALEPSDVALDELVAFFQHPARAFLRQRLNVSTSSQIDDPADDLPVELDGLQRWAIGDRALAASIAGTPEAEIVRLEWLRGTLPPGALGRPVLMDIGRHLRSLLTACSTDLEVPARPVDIQVPLPDGHLLTGTVPGLRGSTLLTVTYSRLAPKHRLTTWIQYLALVASKAVELPRAVLVGRYRDGAARSVFSGVDPEQASMLLAGLVRMRDEGLRAPLPMALVSSAEYGTRRTRGAGLEDALPGARQAWESDRFEPENSQPEHVLLYGGRVPFDHLLQQRSALDERQLVPAETTRFGELAVALWQPLLHHESGI